MFLPQAPPPCREPAGAGAGAGGRGAASFGENLPRAEQHRAQQVEVQMQQEAEEAVVVLGMKLQPEINKILRLHTMPRVGQELVLDLFSLADMTRSWLAVLYAEWCQKPGPNQSWNSWYELDRLLNDCSEI